jgi:N-hydroxyarylamine O-acetyltransferase
MSVLEDYIQRKLVYSCLNDFSEMCIFHQTSPESIFTRNKICTLATAQGRLSLEDGRLITTVQGVRTELLVESEAAYLDLLKNRFGVVI